MSLQHLQFHAISESDLVRLSADAVEESKVLEFKEALPLGSDAEKREFLSDVTALANTDGGDLVLGLRAEKGVAKELVGLRNVIPDDFVARLENLLRDSVQPRVSGVQMRTLLLANGNHALLIRVPRSLSAPHMIRHQGVTRFCGRNTNGKYDLDVHELRSAFLANETFADRLRSFRLDRVNRLISGGGYVPLADEHLLVLHLLPVIGARPDTRLTTSDFKLILSENQPSPIGSHGWTPSFNFDGHLLSAAPINGKASSYVQVMRNGFLEAVDATTLEPTPTNRAGHLPLKLIPGVAWESRLIEALSKYLKALHALGLHPPYVASLSLLNVRGYTMIVDPRMGSVQQRPIDRDHLLTDEILIESLTTSPERLLRPLFDQVWSACGWHGSINFTEEGNWTDRR